VTKPLSAVEQGLKPHFKVRVVLPGAILHLASWTEPAWDEGTWEWSGSWISDESYGDTLGSIDWRKVIAITWRRSV
jgi:hypothetical protein